MKRRARGCIAIDPRRTSSAQWADVWVGLDVGTDIALANAMGREIIAAGLRNREFIEHATSGFEDYRASVEPCTLERGEQETGVPAAVIREMAHAYATRAARDDLLDARASPSITTRSTTCSRSSTWRC